jgi:hypothetical protein
MPGSVGEDAREAGMPCPRCGNPKNYVYGHRVGCTRCDMRWSITCGTVMCRATIKVRTPDNQDEKDVPPLAAQGGRSPTGGASGGKFA